MGRTQGKENSNGFFLEVSLSLSLFLNTTLKVVQLNLEKMVMITQNTLKIVKSEEKMTEMLVNETGP